MSNKEIIDWVAKAESLGYEPGQLRSVLQQSGYGAQDIEDALLAVQPTVVAQPEPIIAAPAQPTQQKVVPQHLLFRRAAWSMLVLAVGLTVVYFIV